MAGFNLTAKLNLAGPYNIKPVVQSIQSQLSNIKANININVNNATTNNIKGLTTQVNALSSALQSANNNAAQLDANLRSLSSSFSAANSNIKNAATAISQIQTKTTQTSKSLKSATSDMERFGRESALAVKRAGAFAIATAGIFGLSRAISSGIGKAIEFEKGVNKLVQVTKISKEGLKGLTSEIDRLALGLGTSSHEMLEVTKIFTQAGLSIRDTKVAMEAVAKSTLAPSFDNIINTTEGLIAVVGQFKDEMTGAGIGAKDFEKVLGSINRVSADFAVEADDIVSAIRKTGGVFAAASRGIGQPVDQLNELIAVFTSVRATTRESADSIATGLRTIFTRIQRPQTIEMLRELGVELLDIEGKFVGPYEAIQRLGKALNSVDTRSQLFAAVTEELGGIRQIGKLIPAIKQYEEAQKVLGVAQRGQGSLNEDAAIAQQTLANQLAKTREEFLKLVRDISNTSSFQFMAKTTLEVAQGFIKIADSVKELIPLITTMAAIRGLGALNQFSKGFVGSFSTRRNNGGPIGFATGGLVPGVGDYDSVPAQLTPGEFVIRKKAVQSIGVDNLQRLNKGGEVLTNIGGGVVTPGKTLYGDKLFSKISNVYTTKKRTDAQIVEKIKLFENFKNRVGEGFSEEELEDRFVKVLQYQSKNLTKDDIEKLPPEERGDYSIISGGKLKSNNVGKTKRYNVSLDTPVAGLFFNDVPKNDVKINNSIGFNTKQLAETAKAKALTLFNSKSGGEPITNEQINDIYAGNAYAFGIGEDGKNHFNSKAKSGMVKLLHDISTSFKGEGIPEINESSQEGFFNAIGGNGLLGQMFEGFVALYTQSAEQLSNRRQAATFDFDSVNNNGFRTLFGDGISSLGIKYADAKFTDNAESRASIVKKTFDKMVRGDGSFRLVPFANGGSPTDTVPALLTPGEFVINKDSAQRIGYSKLHQLNNADRVQGYANGGVVSTNIGGGLVHSGRMLYGNKYTKGDVDFINSNPIAKSAASAIYTPFKNALDKTTKEINDWEKTLQILQKIGADTTKTEEGLNKAQRQLSTLIGIKSKVTEKAIKAGLDAAGVESEAAGRRRLIRQNTTRQYGFGNAGSFNRSAGQFFGNVKERFGSFKDSFDEFRGFGSGFSKLSDEEKDKRINRRNAQLSSIQNVGFGAIGLAATAQQFMPTPKSAGGAAAQSGLTGLAGGAGIGIELGSILGPKGAVIGGAIGGLYGAITAAKDSFYDFRLEEHSKKIDSSMTKLEESLQKINYNINSNEYLSVVKNTRDIVSAGQKKTELQQEKDSYGLYNMASNSSLLSESIIGPAGIGVSSALRGTASLADYGLGTNISSYLPDFSFNNISTKAQSLYTGENSSNIKNRQDATKYLDAFKSSGEKDMATQLRPEAIKRVIELQSRGTSFDQLNKTDQEDIKNILAKSSPDFQRLIESGSADGLSPERLQKIIDTLSSSALESAKKQGEEIAKMNELSNSLAKNKVQLDLFEESLSRASSALDILSDETNKSFANVDSIVNRATGGNSFNFKDRANPFQDIRLSTPEQISKSLNTLGGEFGLKGVAGFDRVAKQAVEGKQFIDNLPELISNNLVSDGQLDKNKAGNIKDNITSQFKITDPIVKQEVQAKLEQLLSSESGLSTATPAELNQKITDIVGQVAPIIQKSTGLLSNVTQKISGAEKSFFERDFNIQSAQQNAEFQINDINAQETIRQLNEDERRTGVSQSEARKFVQTDLINKTLGLGLGETKNAEQIGSTINELNQSITSAEKEGRNEEANKLRLELERNRKALGILSTNTINLAEAERKLADIQTRNQAAIGLSKSFLGGGLEDKAKLVEGFKLAAMYKSGTEKERQTAFDALLTNPEGFNKMAAAIETLKGFGTKGQEQAQKLEFDLLKRTFGEKNLTAMGIGPDFEEQARKQVEDEKKKIADAQIIAIQTGNNPLREAQIKNTEALNSFRDSLPDIFAQIAAELAFGGERKFATGGLISGPGTGTSDSIAARVSNGEFIVSANSVSRIGTSNLNYINQFGRLPKFANGGIVGTQNQNIHLPQIDVSGLTRVLMGFNSGLENFTKSVDSLKQTKITGTFTHTVNVNLTGSEALKAMGKEITNMVIAEVVKMMPKQDIQQQIENNQNN